MTLHGARYRPCRLGGVSFAAAAICGHAGSAGTEARTAVMLALCTARASVLSWPSSWRCMILFPLHQPAPFPLGRALQDWAEFGEFAAEVVAAVDSGAITEEEANKRMQPAVMYQARPCCIAPLGLSAGAGSPWNSFACHGQALFLRWLGRVPGGNSGANLAAAVGWFCPRLLRQACRPCVCGPPHPPQCILHTLLMKHRPQYEQRLLGYTSHPGETEEQVEARWRQVAVSWGCTLGPSPRAGPSPLLSALCPRPR